MPAMTYPRTVSYQAMPASPPRRPRWQLPVLIGVAILVVAAATTVVMILLVGSRGPGTFTVEGTVELKSGQFDWQDGNPATCSGSGLYSDMHGGADVSISDASGKTIAVGRFQTGSPRGIKSDGSADWCSLWFTISGIPRGAEPYGLWITHRGPKPYTEAQLRQRLTLGF